MGAYHCPLGGNTDRNICITHRKIRLISRCCVMLRSGTSSKFGTLPATLAPCQYVLIVLEETPLSYNPISNPCDQNWPRNGTFSWIIDLDLWPWNIENQQGATNTNMPTKMELLGLVLLTLHTVTTLGFIEIEIDVLTWLPKWKWWLISSKHLSLQIQEHPGLMHNVNQCWSKICDWSEMLRGGPIFRTGFSILFGSPEGALIIFHQKK